jgi:hypothetical protein
MLAFCLLAVVAAVITALGLRAGGPVQEMPGERPTPVTTVGAPELLLGGALQARPATAVPSRTADLGLRTPVAYAGSVGRASAVPVVAHGAPAPASNGTSTHASTGTTKHSTTTNTTVTTPTSTSTTRPGHGKGHAKGASKATATTTTTSTGSTPPGHAKATTTWSAKIAARKK